MSDHFHIGQAAREIGLNPSTIRYYEQIELLRPPVRSENGYRLYSQDDLARLWFVKQARLLDLPLEEIRDLMAYALDGRCGPLQQHLISLLETKIAEVNERIRELGSLKADLETFHRVLAGRSQMPIDASRSADSAFCVCLDSQGDRSGLWTPC